MLPLTVSSFFAAVRSEIAAVRCASGWALAFAPRPVRALEQWLARR